MKSLIKALPMAMASVLVLMLASCGLVGSPGTATAPQSTFKPAGLSLIEIGQALDRGDATSVQLVDYYLGRIEKFEDQGPRLNAINAINTQARERARILDKERETEGSRGPLHGIPFVVKDNYDVLGMATTGGSVALANVYPSDNSFVVRQLIEAGAIVLAKTNMSGLASSYGRFGYSSFGGLTLNPHNLKRNASGSSSGTAAAVAAGFAPFGLGTDTSGSVRGPASVTGMVGIRPTLGLTSRDGVIPLSKSFDTTAPITQTVADAALVLQTMAGADPSDPATSSADSLRGDYADNLDPSALKGARIGVLTSFFGGDEEVDHAVNRAIGKISSQGADIQPLKLGDKYGSLWNSVLGPVSKMELAAQLNSYLSNTPAGAPKTTKDIISLSSSKGVKASATPANPRMVDGLQAAVKASPDLGDREYDRLTKVEMPRIRQHILNEMERLNLDALVFPTMACVASPRYNQDDPTYSCEAEDPYTASYIGSASGLPEVTVPVGTDSQNLPIGMSFLGRGYEEQTLLNLAYAWEKTADINLSPKATSD